MEPEVLPNCHGAFAETKNSLYRILDSSNSMFLENCQLCPRPIQLFHSRVVVFRVSILQFDSLPV